ncbi:hypothetical protein QBC38DRAFT_146185 [Podospora fimiseda]|uniref:Uncharacterized protein n=1 Tax=Podospora fimiseda TaxID=252190 RepID=A0AAN7H2A6_9PEZI|nr:hypothetical protein QBC38DRAFT_146185 [Podospora fimiseda]
MSSPMCPAFSRLQPALFATTRRKQGRRQITLLLLPQCICVTCNEKARFLHTISSTTGGEFFWSLILNLQFHSSPEATCLSSSPHVFDRFRIMWIPRPRHSGLGNRPLGVDRKTALVSNDKLTGQSAVAYHLIRKGGSFKNKAGCYSQKHSHFRDSLLFAFYIMSRSHKPGPRDWEVIFCLPWQKSNHPLLPFYVPRHILLPQRTQQDAP